jgi:signal transduction histidine kinase
MYQHVRAWLAGLRGAGYPPWADPVMALLFSGAAVWLVIHAANTGGDYHGPVRFFTPDGQAAPAPPGPGAFKDPGGQEPDTAAAVMASLLVAAPLAVRRRWPLAVFVLQYVGVVLVRDQNTMVTVGALLIGAYTLAASGRRPLLSLGALVVAATIVAVSFDSVELPLPDWTAPFVILLPFGLFGLTVRALRARATASAQRAEAIRAGQEAATRAAVADERARIARELHDVVSHHVSVMLIQAGAAAKVLGSQPDLARGALAAIGESGREAMGELRHLLGILAPDGDAGTDAEADAPPPPQPGLDQLDSLVEKVRGAGQPVTVHCGARDVPQSVGMVAYRVVQEALTNALRYAPGARTTVVVEPDGGSLTVEVTDDGAAGGGPTTAGTGSGLVGLAERLRLYGGTLHAGRRPTGGFRVTARLPLDAALVERQPLDPAGRQPLDAAAPAGWQPLDAAAPAGRQP